MIASVRDRDTVLALALEGYGYAYVGHERVQSFGHDALCVYIDKPGGVTVADCAEVNEVLSVALAAEGLLGKHECLEVSSPGIDRPLFKRDDYVPFIGQCVQIKLVAASEGRRRFKGELLTVLADTITLSIDGKSVELVIDDIEKAHACMSDKLC